MGDHFQAQGQTMDRLQGYSLDHPCRLIALQLLPALLSTLAENLILAQGEKYPKILTFSSISTSA